MLHILRQLFKITVYCLICFSCATNVAQKNRSKEKFAKSKTNQKIFYYPYDSVWRATQLAQKYPISVNNMDNGTLETEWIRALDGFRSVPVTNDPSPGLRYKLIFNLVKGKVSGQDSVRITITKKLEKQRDFFSDPEDLESDGIEEKVLFYRIERELIIDEALKKSQR